MNRSQLLAGSVLALLLISAVPLQAAHAQPPYTEKLNVYVAGPDALWFFTFGGINGSGRLSALESTPGLSWYNVTAISTAGWHSDFQAFGPSGYDLIPAPFLPSQGLFLTVGSDSYADASAAASALDPYLMTSFASLSNATGVYSFYSPVSFAALVPLTLLKLLPTSQGGFADAISTTPFMSTDSPFVVLEGNGTSSGFTHSLVVGSITSSALGSAGTPALLSYFGSTVTSLKASNDSSSSVIRIDALAGTMSSTDHAQVANDNAAFTGSYTLTLAAGKAITGVNATVVEQPAPLLATRAVDVGVLHTNSDLAVTLEFKNLSPTYTITNVTFADSWWSGAPAFTKLGGTDNVTSLSLAPGASVTRVYSLGYNGTSAGSMSIPASVVRYTYEEGGAAFNATTRLNPVRLSLNTDDAVVYALLTPVGSLGSAVGSQQEMNITLKNVGTLPAVSAEVGGKTVQGLAAGGGTATVTVEQSATGLTGINVTRSYAVSYQDPSGTSLNATTNVVTDVFSQGSMRIASPALAVSATLAPLSGSGTNLTLAFSTSNLAPLNVTDFLANATLPAQLGCGRVTGDGIACSGGRLTLSYPLFNSTSTVRTYMTYNITGGSNLILPPIKFSGTAGGANLTGASNPVAIPAGLLLEKQFATSQLFPSMKSNVTVTATNAGPSELYGLTLATTQDSFDTLASNSSLSKDVGNVTAGTDATLSFAVTASQVYGALSSTPATASFYFGGTPFSLQGPKTAVEIYHPLTVTIAASPTTPEEGKAFTLTVVISNPSQVSVSDVLFSLPLPAGLALSGLQGAQLSSRTLTVSAGSLGPGADATATATGTAGSGITVPFSGATLTFSYAGTKVSGVVPKTSSIKIAENVTTRYLIPVAAILLVTLAVAFYVRRLASSAPASPK